MKLSLNIQSGTLAGKIFELQQGFLTIGRSEACNVRFDPLSERIASQKHAFIEAKADGFYITDNQSTNGTLLNGQKIQTAKLNSGDVVQFGKNGIRATIWIESQPQFQPQIEPVTQLGQFQVSEETRMFSPQNLNFRNSFSGIGLGRVVEEPKKSQAGKYVGIGVAIFIIVFLSVVVTLIMFASVGVDTAIIASVIAFTPALVYMIPLIWLDRYDPEPFWLLALAFAWGALVSILFSIVVNTLVQIVFGVAIAPQAGDFIGTVFSAPIFEEASKGFGLVLLLLIFRRYFDDILDGIVFAGMIALGFATVENVLYYGRALLTGEADMIAMLFVLRGVLSPFAHVTFTAMTGIGCGIARESHNIFVRILLPILGYGCAVFLHFVWNFMATILDIRNLFEGSWYYGYFFLQFPFFLIFVAFAFYVMRRQNKIISEMLAIDVARGLIPEEHLNTATSAFRSTFWLLNGIFSGKYWARSKYLRAIGKLGLSYWHIQRATAAQGQTGSFQQNPILREEVLRWRDKV